MRKVTHFGALSSSGDLTPARHVTVTYEKPSSWSSLSSSSSGGGSRKVMSEAKKVQVITSCGAVLATYASQKEASRRTGINRGDIQAICSGGGKGFRSIKGFSFRYADRDAELNQLSMEELTEAASRQAVDRGEHVVSEFSNSRTPRKIQVSTSNGHVLAVYDSYLDAATRTRAVQDQIIEVCHKQRTHAKGFLFSFADPQAELKQLSFEELYEEQQGAIARGQHEEDMEEQIKPQKVSALNLQGRVLATYDSQADAAKKTGIFLSIINQHCESGGDGGGGGGSGSGGGGGGPRAKQLITHGVIFRLADPQAELKQLSLEELHAANERENNSSKSSAASVVDTRDNGKAKSGGKQKKVQVVTSQGHTLAIYESASEAARRTGISDFIINQALMRACMHAKGYLFRFANPLAELNQLSLEELEEANQSAIDRGEHVMIDNTSTAKIIQAVTAQGNVLAIYQSVREASRRTGINHNKISGVCIGKEPHVDGIIFRYCTNPHVELKQLSLEELLAAQKGDVEPVAFNNTGKKRISVITSQGNVLATYESANEAARQIGLDRGHIGLVCRGKAAHAKGFLLRLADPEIELNQLSLDELRQAQRDAIKNGKHVVQKRA